MINLFDSKETAQIISDYQSGMTLREVADKHFASNITILNYLKRAGVERRPRHNHRRARV